MSWPTNHHPRAIMTVSILQADARHLPIADKSVDLVFCSPPYEAARTYGIGFDLRGQEWVNWAVDCFMEAMRVCRGLVAWNCEGQTRKFQWSATPALLMADLHRRGVKLRKPPIFHRVGIPGSGGPDWLRNDYEFIVCGTSDGRLPWSNNTAMGHPPKWAPGGEMSNRTNDGARRNQWGGTKSNGTHRKSSGEGVERYERPSHRFLTKDEKLAIGGKRHTKRDPDASREQVYLEPVLANPGNVIKCKVGGGQMGSKLTHENEAPFPEALAEFFVRSFCPPGGIVLDTFSGSGTTAAVAVMNGRNAIATDIRESQCELTRRRVAEAENRKSLFAA